MVKLINGRTPEEIKTALKVCPEDMNDCPLCPYTLSFTCRDSVMSDALAYIEHLEAAQPKWISVKERLPTDKDATEEGRVACVLSKMCGTIAGERRFYLWEAVVSNPEFFAYWMPLPEPPEEEDE